MALLTTAIPATWAAAAPAQQDSTSGPPAIATPAQVLAAYDPNNKQAVATRTDTPPVIDGVVDEATWDAAVVVADFQQREPVEGGVPSQRTEARVLYDNEYLYVSFICFDQPGNIRATELRRDQRMRTDDTIAVILDTFHDHRNAFVFRVNPLGTKYDMTLQNESQINSQWDEAWEARATLTERGWETEMAIPFRILRYRAGDEVWGIDFKREIKETNEISQWSNFRQDFSESAISQSGHLTGLEGLALADRFRLKPFVSAGYTDLQQRSLPETDGDGDIGIDDFKIQITPNLTADLSVNPDFAEVEVDDTRVNLTRFPLFFPEKREFFLESANNFAFGTRPRFGQPPLALLFFSRRIGLSPSREPLPILFGAKMTGKIGGATLGMLNVQTRDSGEIAGRNHTALRIQQDVFQRSSVGALFTNVTGPGGQFNRVAGIDGEFVFFDYFGVSAFVAAAQDDEIDGQSWVGQVQGGWNSDTWTATVSSFRIDPDFETDLGFILRRDVARQNAEVAWKPRPSWGWARQVLFTGSLDYFTDTDGNLVTREQSLSADLRLESGDSINGAGTSTFERLTAPFRIHPDVTIPPGDYLFNEWRLSFRAYQGRRAGGSVSVTGGEFFSGNRLQLSLRPELRIGEKVGLSTGYTFNDVELPEGDFTAHIVNSQVNVSFNDQWLTTAVVQYNSVSDQVSFFGRLNYIYRTGDDFFFVFKQTRAIDGTFNGMSDRSIATKLTYSFDF